MRVEEDARISSTVAWSGPESKYDSLIPYAQVFPLGGS
jgi:hypothetical protein